MKELLLITVTFGALIVGSQAAYCSSDYTYIYCSNGCCGTSYSRYCCSSSYLYGYTWSAGGIAGIVIGSIIGICVFIAIIVVIIKACTKSGSQGRVIRTSPNQMFIVSTGVHATAQPYPPSQPGIAPPAYGVPGMSYPPPPPLTSFPGQPVESGKMS